MDRDQDGIRTSLNSKPGLSWPFTKRENYFANHCAAAKDVSLKKLCAVPRYWECQQVLTRVSALVQKQRACAGKQVLLHKIEDVTNKTLDCRLNSSYKRDVVLILLEDLIKCIDIRSAKSLYNEFSLYAQPVMEMGLKFVVFWMNDPHLFLNRMSFHQHNLNY